MIVDMQPLKDEIVSDPANVGYKNSDGTWKDSATIAELANTPHPIGDAPAPVTGSLTAAQVFGAGSLLSYTTIAAIFDAVNNLQSPSHAAAVTLQQSLIMAGAASMAEGSPTRAAAEALVAEGVIPQQEAAAIIASVTTVSPQPTETRSQAVYGNYSITASDVDAAAALQ